MFVLVIFSIYSLLLFGELCQPDDEDDDARETFIWSKEIKCSALQEQESPVKHYWSENLKNRWKWIEKMIDYDFSLEYSIAQFSWVLLVVFTCIFCIREVAECLSLQRKFFKSFDSYRHIIIDILLILCLLKGYPVPNFKLQRWQYHVATLTTFLLWFQMMIVAGKYPGYGKYIYMFR